MIENTKVKPSFVHPAQYQSRVCPVPNKHFFGWTAIAWIVARIRANDQQRPSKVDPTASCAIDADTWIFDPPALAEMKEDDNWVLEQNVHQLQRNE